MGAAATTGNACLHHCLRLHRDAGYYRAVTGLDGLLERWSRHKARYHHTSSKYSRLPRYQLRGGMAVVAVLVCALPLLLGFVIPVGQLLYWSITVAKDGLDSEFVNLVWHSLMLATLAAVFALLLALILGYGKRLRNDPLVNLASRIAAMGYAIPGTVIAIGVLIPFAWADTQLNHLSKLWLGNNVGLLLSGTLFTLLFAYNVRFLAVSLTVCFELDMQHRVILPRAEH